MNGHNYIVWCPSLGQTKAHGRHFSALDMRHAAEMWAEWRDFSTAEFEIVRGSPAKVMVANDRPDAMAHEFVVSGETLPCYTARRVVMVSA
jgi:hypothetical protein